MKFKKFIKILNKIKDNAPEGIIKFPSEESLKSLPKEDRESYLDYAMNTVAESVILGITKKEAEDQIVKAASEGITLEEALKALDANQLERKAMGERYESLIDEDIKSSNETAKEVIPVIDTINSIIAQNLKRLDTTGEALPVHELLKLANLSHTIRLPEE